MKPFRSKKNSYNFLISSQKSIQISSDFDNGNINLIKQLTQLQYRLQSVPDSLNNNNTVYNNLNNNVNNNKKSWFYFKITASENIKLKLYIEGVRIYDQMYQEYNWGKPVYKIGQEGQWKQLKDAFLIYREQVQLVIQYTFQSSQSVYFALSIPFTYTQNQKYLKNLSHIIPQSLHFTDSILLQTSILKKNLHMLTIQQNYAKNNPISNQLSSRSIILITCRVHPGEVSSSFTLMGMLQFIIKPFCLQSQILRKMFTFIIFPMVNPQGVYEGNYRMDLHGENLNRVYLQPDEKKNQTIYAIKNKIQQFINKGDKIMFHFDLHSHSTLRRSFLYGNAFDDIVLQTETQLYSKLLQRNSIYFQQSLCQFGQKHMKFKDKGQQMTKQGCARVVISKLASVVYSYTIQSSIFPIQPKPSLSLPLIINKQFQVMSQSQSQYIFGYYDFSLKQYYSIQQINIIDQNKLLGISILQSILDIFIKNPYSSIQLSTLYQYRKNIALKNLNNQERFKMLDTKAYQKYKSINQYVEEEIYLKMFKINEIWGYLAVDDGFNKVQWPQKYQWFKLNQKDKIKDNKKIKIKKLKSSYSHSQKSIVKSGEDYKIQNNLTSVQTNMKKTDLSKLRSKTQINEFQLPNIKKYSQQTKDEQSNIQKQANSILLKIKSSSILRPLNHTIAIRQKDLQGSQQLSHNFINQNSKIILTFLQDNSESQKQHNSRSIQKRLLALKMGSKNRKQNRLSKSKEKSRINEMNIDDIFKNQTSQLPQIKLNNIVGKQKQKELISLRNIKLSSEKRSIERIKTEQVLLIQQQQQTEQALTKQRTYLNSLKKSYNQKQLSCSNSHSRSNNSLNPITNKLLLLHKFNQSKKINHNHNNNNNNNNNHNKSSLMKFPQIGKQFLITNMKVKCFNQNEKIIGKIQESLVQNNIKQQIKYKQDTMINKDDKKNKKSHKKMLKIVTQGDMTINNL